jgi:hypothetical protein
MSRHTVYLSRSRLAFGEGLVPFGRASCVQGLLRAVFSGRIALGVLYRYSSDTLAALNVQHVCRFFPRLR